MVYTFSFCKAVFLQISLWNMTIVLYDGWVKSGLKPAKSAFFALCSIDGVVTGVIYCIQSVVAAAGPRGKWKNLGKQTDHSFHSTTIAGCASVVFCNCRNRLTAVGKEINLRRMRV